MAQHTSATRGEVRVTADTRDLFREAADRIDAEAKAGRRLRHADVWLLNMDEGRYKPNGGIAAMAFLEFEDAT